MSCRIFCLRRNPESLVTCPRHRCKVFAGPEYLLLAGACSETALHPVASTQLCGSVENPLRIMLSAEICGPQDLAMFPPAGPV